MKKHIKLAKRGARSLLTNILLAGALISNVSYTPKHEFPEKYQKIKTNPNKTLERIDWNYKLPNKDYKNEKGNFYADSDTVLLARLVFGESRGSSLKTKISNAYTAVNRANDTIDWNGKDLREAILKPYQYSCFNKYDVNRKKLMNPVETDSSSWAESMKVAYGVLKGIYRDPTDGATHYHTKDISPYWSKNNRDLARNESLKDVDHHYYNPRKKEI
ncbi:MAG TPA: cell wall hydrolase [Candidatus Nanoarchaeia archaeon]|nr:cell wall hydrolase [Candidatus Nanoarchaeia archaeon]